MASTNQSPFYKKAEENFLSARSIDEKILYLKEMIKECPKHKSSEKMLAHLRSRLSKLIKEGEAEKKRRRGQPALIKKTADALVSLVGLTNSGKSSLLSILTNANPKISEFPYTTTQPEQGVFNYGGCKIQVVEVPALRGIDFDSENLGILRISDLIVLVITTNEEIEKLLQEIKEANIQVTTLILHNKSDIIAKIPAKSELSVSSLKKENLQELKAKIFSKLNLIRIYTKEPGKKKSELPIILRKASKIETLAEKIHKSFLEKFNYALVWGKSVKFQGQRCGLDHDLQDQDVVEIYLKK